MNDNVKEWLLTMGLSQRQAARELGCSRGALAGWEAKPETTPKYIRLAMRALALGITVADRADPYPADDI